MQTNIHPFLLLQYHQNPTPPPSPPPPPALAEPLIAVVTDSNRGIGHGIIQLLSSIQLPQPLVIYATSRCGTHLDIKPQPPNEIRYEKPDVSNKITVTNVIRKTLKSYPSTGAIDTLINNAAVNLNQNKGLDEARKTIDLNYRGLRDNCSLFLTLGKMASNPCARVVNVSSTGHDLSIHSPTIQERLINAQSVKDVDAVADEYIAAYEKGTLAEAGFGVNSGTGGRFSYQMSKACVNAATKVLARENEGVLINCCCPGWVNSDMGRIIGRPPKSLGDGAKIPVRLAVGDIGGKSGTYWGQ